MIQLVVYIMVFVQKFSFHTSRMGLELCSMYLIQIGSLVRQNKFQSPLASTPFMLLWVIVTFTSTEAIRTMRLRSEEATTRRHLKLHMGS